MKIILSIFNLLFFTLISHSQSLVPSYTVKLPDVIHETSGLEIFGDSIFVTHNDSGDGPILYFIDSLGQFLKQKKLINAQSFDWEDITYDGKKYLYIGDIGNNSNQREKLEIHQFNILDSTFKTGAIGFADQKFPTKESLKNFDVEGMAYYKDEIFLFTKDNSQPYTGYTRLYKYSFNNKNKEYLKVADSIYLGDGGFLSHSVTAADFNDDYTVLALITYKFLYLFYDFPEGKPFQGKMVEFSLPIIHQREAICFDSKNNLWMTDEKSKLLNGGKLYKYELKDFFTTTLRYKKSELGIVSVKSNGHKLSFKNDQFLYFKLKAEISTQGKYRIEFLEDGIVKSFVDKKFDKKIELDFSFEYADVENKKYAVRIYKDNKLLYSNDIDL